MQCEPADTMADTRMDAAVGLLLRLRAELPETPASELAGQAVDAMFCTCLSLRSDTVACQLASVRAPLIAEVLHRARLHWSSRTG